MMRRRWKRLPGPVGGFDLVVLLPSEETTSARSFVLDPYASIVKRAHRFVSPGDSRYKRWLVNCGSFVVRRASLAKPFF